VRYCCKEIARIFVKSSSTFLIFFDDDAYAFTSTRRNFLDDDARDSTSTTSRCFFDDVGHYRTPIAIACHATSWAQYQTVTCSFPATPDLLDYTMPDNYTVVR